MFPSLMIRIVGALAIMAGAVLYVHHLESAAYARGQADEHVVGVARETAIRLNAVNQLAAAQAANDAQTALGLSAQKERINAAEKTAAERVAAADRATAAARQLQHDVTGLLAQLAGRPDAGPQTGVGTVGTPATTDPAGMLADVFGELERRTGLYALEADRRGDAVQECQRAYEVTP